MVNFAPKRNATYMFGTPIPTLLSFLPLPPESVGTDGVRRPHKFSLFDRFPFSSRYGVPQRTPRARSCSAKKKKELREVKELSF